MCVHKFRTGRSKSVCMIVSSLWLIHSGICHWSLWASDPVVFRKKWILFEQFIISIWTSMLFVWQVIIQKTNTIRCCSFHFLNLKNHIRTAVSYGLQCIGKVWTSHILVFSRRSELGQITQSSQLCRTSKDDRVLPFLPTASEMFYIVFVCQERITLGQVSVCCVRLTSEKST